ncbi:MAG: hypothetical protein RLZZ29_2053 [Cyanobacteriota bacterium]|jgi:tetratricopeptide (TPR) repeat protein
MNLKTIYLLPIVFCGLSLPVQSQVVQSPNKPVQTKPNDKQPSPIPSKSENTSLLSITGGDRLMKEGQEAVSGKNYTLAVKKLQEARQIYNQLSTFYQELNASFSGIDFTVSDSQRKKALETAQKRDEATYQLALVHRSLNQPDLAIPLLIQVIKSQNPAWELGKKAYQQLWELGFVDTAYPGKTENPGK